MNLYMVKNLPIPISGLILALLSLGNLLQGYFRLICGSIAVIFIILMILRLFLYVGDVKKDLSNPVILSNSGTFSMSLMILSTYINTYSSNFAFAVWILGIALHILLIIYFSYQNIIRNFNLSMVYPSYWIVFVGITMAAITAHVHGLNEIGFIFFLFGFISMIITLPLIIYGYLKYPIKPESNKPLICIFTALMSILIVGYVNSFNQISYTFLMLLYTIAFLFFLFALYKLISYRRIKFYPSFSAFTFPFVITAIASKEVFVFNQNLLLNVIVLIQTVMAIVLVTYVLFRYLKFLYNLKGQIIIK